jgi:hypothetical protein
MSGPPPVEILSAMRELVASGIQIYIGTKSVISTLMRSDGEDDEGEDAD